MLTGSVSRQVISRRQSLPEMPAFTSFLPNLQTIAVPSPYYWTAIRSQSAPGWMGDCSQFFISSKSPRRPFSPREFPSQLNVASSSITHPDTPPQPPGIQLWETPQHSLLSAVSSTSAYQSDDSTTVCTTVNERQQAAVNNCVVDTITSFSGGR